MEKGLKVADTFNRPILRVIPGGRMDDPKEKLIDDISQVIKKAKTKDAEVASATIMELCLSYRRGRWLTAFISSIVTILAISLYLCLSR